MPVKTNDPTRFEQVVVKTPAVTEPALILQLSALAGQSVDTAVQFVDELGNPVTPPWTGGGGGGGDLTDAVILAPDTLSRNRVQPAPGMPALDARISSPTYTRKHDYVPGELALKVNNLGHIIGGPSLLVDPSSIAASVYDFYVEPAVGRGRDRNHHVGELDDPGTYIVTRIRAGTAGGYAQHKTGRAAAGLDNVSTTLVMDTSTNTAAMNDQRTLLDAWSFAPIGGQAASGKIVLLIDSEVVIADSMVTAGALRTFNLTERGSRNTIAQAHKGATTTTIDQIGGINTTDLSVNVADASGLPDYGFVVTMGTEDILVRSRVGTLLSFDPKGRGYNGTTKATHANTDVVTFRGSVISWLYTMSQSGGNTGEYTATVSVPGKVGGTENDPGGVEGPILGRLMYYAIEPPRYDFHRSKYNCYRAGGGAHFDFPPRYTEVGLAADVGINATQVQLLPGQGDLFPDGAEGFSIEFARIDGTGSPERIFFGGRNEDTCYTRTFDCLLLFAIDEVATSCTVDVADGLPDSDFVITFPATGEAVLVSSRSGTILTFDPAGRGYLDPVTGLPTNPAPHAIGDTVHSSSGRGFAGTTKQAWTAVDTVGRSFSNFELFRFATFADGRGEYNMGIATRQLTHDPTDMAWRQGPAPANGMTSVVTRNLLTINGLPASFEGGLGVAPSIWSTGGTNTIGTTGGGSPVSGTRSCQVTYHDNMLALSGPVTVRAGGAHAAGIWVKYSTSWHTSNPTTGIRVRLNNFTGITGPSSADAVVDVAHRDTWQLVQFKGAVIDVGDLTGTFEVVWTGTTPVDSTSIFLDGAVLVQGARIHSTADWFTRAGDAWGKIPLGDNTPTVTGGLYDGTGLASLVSGLAESGLVIDGTGGGTSAQAVVKGPASVSANDMIGAAGVPAVRVKNYKEFSDTTGGTPKAFYPPHIPLFSIDEWGVLRYGLSAGVPYGTSSGLPGTTGKVAADFLLSPSYGNRPQIGMGFTIVGRGDPADIVYSQVGPSGKYPYFCSTALVNLSGTCTVAAGVVTGTGTVFTKEWVAQGWVNLANVWYQVGSVVNDTSATLVDTTVTIVGATTPKVQGEVITGTVSVNNGATTVTGVGTTFTTDLHDGEWVTIAGYHVQIQRPTGTGIIDNTHFELLEPWPTTSVSGAKIVLWAGSTARATGNAAGTVGEDVMVPWIVPYNGTATTPGASKGDFSLIRAMRTVELARTVTSRADGVVDWAMGGLWRFYTTPKGGTNPQYAVDITDTRHLRVGRSAIDTGDSGVLFVRGDTGQNEVQVLNPNAAVSGGFLRLRDRGARIVDGVSYSTVVTDTADILPTASAADVETALETALGVGAGQIVCTGGPLPSNAITITYSGSAVRYTGRYPLEVINGSSPLVGGTFTITRTVPGLGHDGAKDLVYFRHGGPSDGSIAPTGDYLALASPEALKVVRIDPSRNLLLGVGALPGSGAGVIGLLNAVTVPTTNPTGGIAAYAQAGAGKVRTASGKIVTFAPDAPTTYTATNVTTDRTYDANATTVDELADVVGTLIADLRTLGYVA